MNKTRHGQVIRYSPTSMAGYGQTSAMIDTPERWNLAYLSHPYEERKYHTDSQFLVLVRRTTQTRLDGGGLDLIESCPTELLVASLFSLTAPRASYLLRKLAVLRDLPLYRAYGEAWLNTVTVRSHLCWYDEFGLIPEELNSDPEVALEANAVMSKVMGH